MERVLPQLQPCLRLRCAPFHGPRTRGPSLTAWTEKQALCWPAPFTNCICVHCETAHGGCRFTKMKSRIALVALALFCCLQLGAAGARGPMDRQFSGAGRANGCRADLQADIF